jgi:hypothetical protein
MAHVIAFDVGDPGMAPGDLPLTPLRVRTAERATVPAVLPVLVRAQPGDRAGCLGAGLPAGGLLAAQTAGKGAQR